MNSYVIHQNPPYTWNRKAVFSFASCVRKEAFHRKTISQPKVVPRSVVNPDCLKPLNCKGLFTTTHANTHRPLIKPMVMAGGEHHVACSTAPIECEFDRLPDRNPGSGLIGIGLISGLRSLSLLGTKISISQPKVVPKSVVNPDCLKPLNCKGLFTTTHANTHRPLIKPMVMASGEHHAACSTLSIECEFDRLPDRNPGSGLIGIGLVSVLRTLFMKININPLIGGLA